MEWIYLAAAVGILAFGITLFVTSRVATPTSVIATRSLEETINGIKRELVKLENTPGEGIGLVLDEVKIVLIVQSEKKDSHEGGLAVPVFNASSLSTSASVKSTGGSKIEIVLVPPKGSQTLSVGSGPDINLADLLIETRSALHRAMQDAPRLETKSLEVELAFVLISDSKTSAAVKAKVISAGVSASGRDTDSNTIKLIYLNPRYAKQPGGGKVTPP